MTAAPQTAAVGAAIRTPDPALEITNLARAFGGLRAVDGVSLVVHPGQVVGLIGPNGAGKTTTINLVSGLLAVTEGSIKISGQDATTAPAHRIAALGLARTYQTSRLFADLSVEQNVELARLFGEGRTGDDADPDASRRPQGLRSRLATALGLVDSAVRSDVSTLLDRLGLTSVRSSPAAMLSYGHQRRLEIARALALRPSVLLLDEPVAGMNDREAFEVGALLRVLADEGLAVLVVEHNMRFVADTAEHLIVLDHGRPLAEGPPGEVLTRPNVIEAYLGTAHAER